VNLQSVPLMALVTRSQNITDVTPIPHNGCRPREKTSRLIDGQFGERTWLDILGPTQTSRCEGNKICFLEREAAVRSNEK